MVEFKKGDYVEVGIGNNVYDKNGCSYYFEVDRNGYNEEDIFIIFEERGNVLYVNKVYNESSINFAGDSKLSDFLHEYVKIELEVGLPVNYNEAEVDRAIGKALSELGGQLLDSKEYKKIVPTNI